MVSQSQRRLSDHRLLAEALLLLADGGLLINELKSYIVLERRVSKSASNKNAISLLQEGVSFMVPDVEAELAANSTGLHAERSKGFPRIQFPNLTIEDVESNKSYFAELVSKAKRESEKLQQPLVGAGH